MALGNLNGKIWRPCLHGALVTVLAGWIFWATYLGASLEWWSFDLPTLFSGPRTFPELVLVELDEPSHDQLRQSVGKPWDRRLHARLVNFLREEGARQVVFDVEMSEQVDDPSATAEMAAALRRHGHVVLAAHLMNTGKKGFASVTILRGPVPELLVAGVTSAVSWNLPGPKGEEDGIVRLHPPGRFPSVDGGAARQSRTHQPRRASQQRTLGASLSGC